MIRMRMTIDKTTKQGVFRTHTKEKTGVLRAERLRDALLEVRIILNAFEKSCMFKVGIFVIGFEKHIRRGGNVFNWFSNLY